jgi:hypothetical protein
MRASRPCIFEGMRGRKQMIVVVCAIVLAVSCGEDDGKAATATSSSPSTTTTTTSTTTSTSTTAVPVRRVGTASTDPKETPGWPDGKGGHGFLTDVRVGRHEGFDRVVFEFDGELPPAYSVQFVELPVRYDPSAEVVELDGAAALLVDVRATSVDYSDPGQPRDTYGPSRIEPPEAGVVMELVRTGDFEGLLEWAVGLPSQAPFAVAQLRDPSRIVVDIDHVR